MGFAIYGFNTQNIVTVGGMFIHKDTYFRRSVLKRTSY